LKRIISSKVIKTRSKLKLHKEETILAAEFLKIIEQSELKKLRRIIRECISYEKSQIETEHNGDLQTLVSHVKIQEVSEQVYDLLLNANIVKSFMSQSITNKKFDYPLPIRWQKLFSRHGIEINHKSSYLKFQIYYVKKLVRNYCRAVILIISRPSKNLNIQSNSTLIYLQTKDPGLGLTSIDEFNFVNWVRRNHLFKSRTANGIAEISKKDLINFVLFKTLVSIAKLTRVSPIEFTKTLFRAPNLIFEYTNLNVTELQKVSLLIIPSSQSWIKSTWHLRFEELGTEVVYVNLSDSSEPSETFDAEFPVNWYALSQWKNILVCSKNQKHIFESAELNTKTISIHVSGVPDWQDNKNKSIAENIAYFSVFDFEPHKNYYGFSTNNDSGYSNINNTLKFIESISEISQELEFYCVYKSKRKISISKRFSEYTEALNYYAKNNKYFILADESIAPRRLIRTARACVHMPFSSTGLIAAELNIPSCFYDPVGLINLDDSGANGAKIVNNSKTLLDWLNEQIHIKTNGIV
jgi:hypothetical protein